MFNFTSLLGAQSQSSASQSLLEFDGGVKILIDVGWDESFDADQLKALERQVPTISLVLLTHATLAHVGAFAHCCKHVPLFNRIPVYATSPVIALARTLLQDLYASTPLAASFLNTSSLSDSYASSTPAFTDKSTILLQPPSHEEIATYFRELHPLKYSQAHQPLSSPFSPPLEGLTITAFSAGHTLGGTIWHIQHGSEAVVYAVDWCQARENILSGAAWLASGTSAGTEVIEQLRRPTALVCSSRGAERPTFSGGWKRRDETLLDCIRPTLAEGGTVLIPCDSSARVLELAYVLEHAWRDEDGDKTDKPLKNAKLYLAGRSYGSTIQHTRRMLEWMNENVVGEFEAAATAVQQAARTQPGRTNLTDKDATHPFEFKHIKILERSSQLERAFTTPGPKVFLASDASLGWGYSKDLMERMASDKTNLVILTDQVNPSQAFSQGSDESILAVLYDIWKGHIAESEGVGTAKTINCNGRTAKVSELYVTPLEGKDLSLYQQYLAGQRQRQNTANVDKSAKLESSADVVDEGSSSSSSSSGDSDAELQGRALNLAATINSSKHKLGLTDDELGINILLRRKNVHDYDVRGKRGRERVFPYVAKRRRTDEFGELIRPEDYLRAEERGEDDDAAAADDRNADMNHKDTSLGQKRRWDDKRAPKYDRGKRGTMGSAGQRQNGVSNGEEAVADGNGGGHDTEEASDESDYEPAEPSVQGPVKVTTTTRDLQLNLNVGYVDYSGLHDKRTLQMLLPLIRPRKLILTSGDEQETLDLATECRKLLEASSSKTTDLNRVDVFSPRIGTTVNASVDTNAWTIKLSQALVSQLHWQNVRGLGVVTVTGRIKPPDLSNEHEGNIKKKQKLLSDSDKDVVSNGSNSKDSVTASTPTLDSLPANMVSATRATTQPLHVGDLRLADLRKLMQASGHSAEFKGEGTLLVDGMIVVRKSGVGKIEVECGAALTPGASSHQLGGSFYTVKKKIYESLAVVAAT